MLTNDRRSDEFPIRHDCGLNRDRHHRNQDELWLCLRGVEGAVVKVSRKGILLAALAIGCMGAAGIYYLKPRHGECVKRNMMFWRTHVKATKLRDNLYMLNVYGTDLINANTAALIGDEGVLLVDPGHPEMIRKELGALPSIRDKRVRFSSSIPTGIPITPAPTASSSSEARLSSVTAASAIITRRPIGLRVAGRAIRRR